MDEIDNLCEKYLENQMELEKISNLLKHDISNSNLTDRVIALSNKRRQIRKDMYRLLYKEFGKKYIEKHERWDALYGGY